MLTNRCCLVAVKRSSFLKFLIEASLVCLEIRKGPNLVSDCRFRGSAIFVGWAERMVAATRGSQARV